MPKSTGDKTVFGIAAPPARFTTRGKLRVIGLIAAPVLALLLALDVIGYLIAKYALGSCYGILCWFS
ncbi:MAG: hypothetical protein AAF607_14820 [Pseudomonadota bacterium]